MAARKEKGGVEAPAAPGDAAFLAAIRDAPDDDAPRLVYADHLLESPDLHERQWGELIIAQCTIASRPRRSEEWRRARDLEIAVRAAVTDRVRGRDWRVFSWARGLPEGINCPAGPLRRQWKALATFPLRRLALHPNRSHRAEVTVGDVAWAIRHFPRVEAIVFGNRDGSITLDPRRLDDLDETSRTIAWRDEALPSPTLRDAVTELEIHAGLPLYLNEPFPALERLTLRSADAEAVLAMTDRPLKRLTWHADGAAREVGARLANRTVFSRLEHLEVSVRLVRELAEAIGGSAISELELTYDTTDDGLARFVAPPGLRRLGLLFSGGAWHGLSRASARYRLPLLHAPALESLSLGRFVIDESFGATALPALASLELFECIVEERGLPALSRLDGLHRPTLLRCALAETAQAELRARWPDVIVVEPAAALPDPPG